MIQSPDRPVYFYKYKYIDQAAPEHSSRIFTHNELHFCTADDFNDPFDCRFRVELIGSDDEKLKFCEKLLKGQDSSLNGQQLRAKAIQFSAYLNSHDSKKMVQEAAIQEVGTYGICCFSKVRDNILMWAHYANAHRGFCLEFLVEPKPRREYEILEPHRVKYSDKYPVVNRLHDTDKVLAEKTILTKANQWKYEEEWRMVDPNGPGPHQFSSRLLTGVIFGCRMPENHKKMIRDWCKDRETTVEYYEAQLSDDSYSLKIIPAQ